MNKFLSRKLLVTLSGVIAAVASGQWYIAAGLIVAYVLAQAHVDARAVASIVDVVAVEAKKVATATVAASDAPPA